MRPRIAPLTLLLVACCAVPASSQKLRIPSSPPPQYILGSVDKAGNLNYRRNVHRKIPTVRTRVVLKDGKKVEEKQTVYVPVVSTVESRQPLKSIDIYNGNGEKVDAEDFKDAMSKPRVLLLSSNGKKPDPFYLKLLKPEVYIIVPKRAKRRAGVRRRK